MTRAQRRRGLIVNEVFRRRRQRLLMLASVLTVTLAAGTIVAPLASLRTLYGPRTQQQLSESVYEITTDLNAIGAALVAGDERGWLEIVDPTKPDLREQFRRYYAVLRKKGVSAWYIGVDPQQLLRERVLPQSTMRVWFVYCVRGTACGSPARNPTATTNTAAASHPKRSNAGSTPRSGGQLDVTAWTTARSFGASVQWNLRRGRWKILTFVPDSPSLGSPTS